jgi:signal transduction histidine kinase
MAELEAERFQLKLERIDLCEVAEATVAEFRQTDPGAGREIILEKSGAGLSIHADQRAVRQMVLKLLSNAAKFSAAGTAIRVTTTRVGDGSRRVSVTDMGIGMSAEEAELAVQPFRQIDGGLARKYEGIGLGLSIVSKLVERHGGRLTIASAPQKGTHVSLDFPTPDSAVGVVTRRRSGPISLDRLSGAGRGSGTQTINAV